MFPVGAICRVVDIIHYNDDKDKLTNKEFLKIQDNYVNNILKAGESHHIHFVQYLIGIVRNSERKFLYVELTELFDSYLMYDDKSDHFDYISGYWKNIFDNVKDEWKLIGRTKSNNSIHHYYLFEFDEAKHKLSTSIGYEWLNLEDFLKKSNDWFIKNYFS